MRKLIVALGILALTACSGPQAAGEFRSHVPPDRLFTAALGAVPAVGYTLVNSNRADGIVTAQQGVILGKGSAAGLTAIVSRDGGDSVLRVQFTAPPGTFALGDYSENVSEDVAAVRGAVPDLHAAR